MRGQDHGCSKSGSRLAVAVAVNDLGLKCLLQLLQPLSFLWSERAGAILPFEVELRDDEHQPRDLDCLGSLGWARLRADDHQHDLDIGGTQAAG